MGSASQQYLDVITGITREGGATRAATARANAQIWGGTVAKLGDFASDAIKQYSVDKKAKKDEQWQQDLSDLFKRSADEFKAQQQPSIAELTAGTPTATETYTPGGLQGSFAGNVPPSHVTTETTAAPQTFTGPELKAARQPRSSPFPTPSEILALGQPLNGIKVIDGLAALQKLNPQDDDKTRVERMRAAYVGLDQFSEAQKAAALPGLMGAFEQVYGINLGEKAYTPERWAAFGKALQVSGAKPPEDFTLSEGQSRFKGTGGEPIATVPKAGPAAGTINNEVELAYAAAKGDTPEERAMNALEILKAQKGTAGGVNPTEWSVLQAAANGDKGAQNALRLYRQQHPQAAGGQEPLVAVMKDGKPVLVRRSQAEGQTPASTREQGRNVTSGDVGRISEMDSALDQAVALESVVQNTGAGSWIGTVIPNAVTQVTGLGAASKTREGVIRLAKQIVGKGLEGGVLRKEDEDKYAAILPTIGDAPAVAKGKLQSLVSTLQRKRTDMLENLESGGYDISRFPSTHETKPQGTQTAKTPTVGSIVTWQGKRYRVKAITNGQAELEEP